MKSHSPVHITETWNQLVRAIEPAPCILLKGEADHFMLGWGIESEFKAENADLNFEKLQTYIDINSGRYIFGYFSYDARNSIEKRLTSSNEDAVGFPVAHFFVTKHVIELKNGVMSYFGDSDFSVVNEFLTKTKPTIKNSHGKVDLKAKTSREEYLKNVREILAEIQYGNIYEMNYCVNFLAENCSLNPIETFEKLHFLTEAPFSVYLNTTDHFVMSASPERYIQKKGNRVISQPIKGTARRGKSETEDDYIKKELAQNSKERSENIMIVDLVRNDLSKIASKNSVHVDALCEPHTFKTVHQLISTVCCDIKPGIKFTDIIMATFPMGSMTGAPKVSAMEIAERTENFRRGLYSGTIGYIDPAGDFDFNVVIRSILYNPKKKVVSCSVGGAITMSADPEKEYEECLLKLNALQRALE